MNVADLGVQSAEGCAKRPRQLVLSRKQRGPFGPPDAEIELRVEALGLPRAAARGLLETGDHEAGLGPVRLAGVAS